jgi:hypothetical protein
MPEKANQPHDRTIPRGRAGAKVFFVRCRHDRTSIQAINRAGHPRKPLLPLLTAEKRERDLMTHWRADGAGT